MTRRTALVTGANGEIGHALLREMASADEYAVVALDLTPLGDDLRAKALASYAGNVKDRHFVDQVAALHDVDCIFHLAALLSARGEHDPYLAHEINVEGTLNVLRV